MRVLLFVKGSREVVWLSGDEDQDEVIGDFLRDGYRLAEDTQEPHSWGSFPLDRALIPE